MRFQDGAADRVDYTAGRAPTGATHTVAAAAVAGLGDLPAGTRVTVLETSVSEDTAALLGLHHGDVLALGLDGSDQLVGAAGDGAAPCAVELVGIFRPVDPQEPLWYGEAGLLRASTRVYGPSFAINDARALMAPDAYPPLLALTGPAGTVFRNQWRYFVDPDRIEARRLGDLTAALQRTESTFPTSATVARQARTAQLTSGLADLLEGFRARWSFATTVMAAGAVGPAVMAIGALGLIALLSARGRRPVLGRWRTRGASTPQVLRATLAEGLIVAGPAALAGTAAAIVMFAGGPPEASLLTGGVVLGAGVLLVGGLEIPPALVPRAGGRADRDETLGAQVADVRPDRRAVAAELAILLLAVASIILRRARRRSGWRGRHCLTRCSSLRRPAASPRR
jgi:putative ABC transport system permease protein